MAGRVAPEVGAKKISFHQELQHLEAINWSNFSHDGNSDPSAVLSENGSRAGLMRRTGTLARAKKTSKELKTISKGATARAVSKATACLRGVKLCLRERGGALRGTIQGCTLECMHTRVSMHLRRVKAPTRSMSPSTASLMMHAGKYCSATTSELIGLSQCDRQWPSPRRTCWALSAKISAACARGRVACMRRSVGMLGVRAMVYTPPPATGFFP